jgi:hypothetical protein
MAWRKWLLAALGVAMLGGCAAYPYAYNDPYYNNGYAYNTYPGYAYNTYPGYYGPGYYVAPPSVSFGLAFNDEEHHWRHH